MAYLHDIRSVRDVHPNLPPILAKLDLNRRILANTPIDRAALVHAQAVAQILEGINEIGREPLVTNAVVQSAKLRARAVEAAHVAAEFTPVDIVQALQNINNRLDELSAMGHNNRILARHAHRQAPSPYLPLRKTIAGHGLALAQDVAHNADTRNGLEAPNPVPVVNTTPPHFNPNIAAYTHLDILDLIIFYNDDFGIVQADTLPSRVEAFRRFLTEI